MKYISVQFFESGRKPKYHKYTYSISRRLNKVVMEGDFLVVPTPTGNTVAKVHSTDIKCPSFQTKEVIKKVDL